LCHNKGMETQEQKLQKLKSRWLIPTIIVVGIIFLGLGTWAGYIQWNKPKNSQQLPQEELKDEFEGWQIYRNEEYGFEFKYPQSLKTTKDEIKIRYENGQKWYQLELTDSSAAEAPFISFEVNPDGYGPFFPDKRYEIKESTDNGIETLSILLEEKSENSDDGYTLIMPNSIAAKNGNNYFTHFIFKEGGKDWEPVFKELLSTFKFIEPISNLECNNSSKYFVVSKNYEGDLGSDFLVKYKTSEDQTISCKYVVEKTNFEIKDQGPAYFFALTDNFLILDYGTAPPPRTLIVYDLNSRKEVYTDSYSAPFSILNDVITYWSPIEEKATNENCPGLSEYTANWFGAAIEAHVSVNLSNLVKKELGEYRCSPTQ